MSVAWSWAFDTPFKWTKQVASFFGGTRQGMVMSWPGHIKDAGGIRTQFHHIIDIVPTILEATGVQAPVMVNGIAQSPIEGVSMAYTWDKANAKAQSKRETQYFEMFGNRAIYHDGWMAAHAAARNPRGSWARPKCPRCSTATNGSSTTSPRITRRTTTSRHKNPEKLKELQELFLVEAQKYQVFPLDNSILERLLTPRPSSTAGRTSSPTRVKCPACPTAAPPTPSPSPTPSPPRWKSHGRCRGHAQHARRPLRRLRPLHAQGQAGVHLQFLGLERFRWEGKDALAPGKHTIVFDFKYDGPGMAKGGTGVLSVDGKEVDTKKIPHTIPALMTIDESFDVGVDTRTGVDDKDYQPPFRFTGKLDKLTIKLVPPKRTAEEEQLLQQKTQDAKKAAQ